MTALRRISTRRLIALCAVTVAALIGVTAVAMAMSGGGPKPPPKPLANAVQDALGAPSVPGVSARIQFTNHLVDASSIEGTDPLLAGASGRLWASPEGGGKLRLELQSQGGGGDSQVLVSGNRFEIYDGSSGTVFKGTLPEEEGGKDGSAEQHGVPGLGEIEAKIGEVEEHAELSGAVPSDVAGQPTYTLHVAPKHDGGLLGGAEIAWDAGNGVPLRAAIYSSASSSPVLQLEATDVSFEAISSSVFEISPPQGAKVVDLSPSSEVDQKDPSSVVGAEAVQQGLGFQLVAPSSLAGLPQGEVRRIEIDGRKAALATYGKGLGGIAVIESVSEPGEEAGSGSEGGLSLPKVSINGARGEELDTALGTVLRFSRSGVDYIVIGSVPPAAAEAAARAL